MEVVIPAVSSMDFDFNSARSPPPYLSAPTSPRRFGEYFFSSAPTSPTRISQFYRDFDNLYMANEPPSAIPFDWEEKPGTPKSPKAKAIANDEDDDDKDFAFNISEDLEKASLSAEELFDGGKIRPLKPPPRLQLEENTATLKSPLLSPRSPRSPISRGRQLIREVFSPRTRKQVDPFAAAVENTRNKTENERGRESGAPESSSSSSHRATRSLSPFRVSAYPWEEEEKEKQQQQPTKQSSFPSKPSSSSSSSSKSFSRKWRLKDFLLFRSASEGRATDKEPYGKYASLFRKTEDGKNSSFRSTDGSGSNSGSRRKGVSAHELHYTKNKAVSEELKKKTFLPYKYGILGRLAFNPAVFRS